MVHIVLEVVLVLICSILLGWQLAMKWELRKLKKELISTKELSYNRQLTVTLFDKDLTKLAIQMNDNLDYQKQLKWKAEQSEQKLRQSISDIAHDLRTPLTVIKGNLQMLDQKGQLDNRAKEYLSLCLYKTEAVRTMIDEFFEMSLLESDTNQVEVGRVDVTKLLVQFVLDHEALIKEHELSPKLILPDHSIMILAEEQLLLRMLSNLLNNVFKYAKASFRLSLEEWEKDKERCCRITFTNPASDASLEIAHLFDRTYRGNTARHGGGAGLGLYIVKLLADKQGAEVGADMKEGMLSIYMDFSILNE